MGKNLCPLCGAPDRSHEVKVEMREHGGRNKAGHGGRFCVNCAAQITDEFKAILHVARKGISAGINVPILEEAEDERLEDERDLTRAEGEDDA